MESMVCGQATHQKSIALGDGVVRLHMPHPENEESMTKIVISGGYAEIDPTGVIILADHARRVDDIDADVVRETRDDVIDQMLSLPEDVIVVPTTKKR